MTVFERAKKQAVFKDIKIGNCFIFEGSFYFKMEGVLDCDNVVRNAVNVITGKSTEILPNDKVVVIHAHLEWERM